VGGVSQKPRFLIKGQNMKLKGNFWVGRVKTKNSMSGEGENFLEQHVL